MAKISVDEVQSRIAALVDQDENTSNISSTDYSLRLKYINMALQEWQEITDWQSLYTEYNVLVSTSTGNASIALPTDFRKPASAPVITFDGATTDQFPITRPQEARRFGSSDRRVEFLGNPQDNYVMRVYGEDLVSGASVKIPYYMSSQSLVSPANIAEIPDPQYLVKKSITHLWEAREDARFPQMKQEAQLLLQNMIEHEETYPEGSTFSKARTDEETKYGFRIGRD